MQKWATNGKAEGDGERPGIARIGGESGGQFEDRYPHRHPIRQFVRQMEMINEKAEGDERQRRRA